ncbi:MAG: tripartite tricarboxylate transporter substrate binding protein [Alphaproteobacteria bacterium]|nr:tripartite tricarboxylate transporter substrate binding protein [Alphaproteobacteria bacterium]
MSYRLCVRPLTSLKLALAMLVLAPATLAATELPQRPVRIVVPFAPAGFVDRIGRVIADELSKSNPQTRFYVENKPGAGGIIGAMEVAKSPPDGTTLLISSLPTNVLAPLVNPRPDFRPVEDFTHIVYIGGPPNVFTYLTTNTNVKSFADFVRVAKETPQKYGTGGVGTVGHLSAEFVGRKAGLKLVHVPYNGPMLADLLSGTLDMGSLTASTVMGNVDAGTLRLIAVGSEDRMPKYPDVPTLKELGFEISPTAWMSLSGPRGLAPELANYINKQVIEILARPNVKDALAQELITPIAMTPAQLTEFIKKDIATWRPIVESLGVVRK